jgi:hypothetical protein
MTVAYTIPKECKGSAAHSKGREEEDHPSTFYGAARSSLFAVLFFYFLKKYYIKGDGWNAFAWNNGNQWSWKS